MNRKEHEQFHRDAARVARAKEELLFGIARRYQNMIADNHERAANGEKLFAECCELVTDDDGGMEVGS